MIRTATFSADRKCRFDLVRDWRDEIAAPNRTALFAMLNPSDAEEERDDPTTRKVVGFGRRWGYGRVVLVNLIPVVSTDPWKLPHWNGIEMQNRAVVQQWMGEADIVVAAWGNQPASVARRIALPELVYLFCQTAPVTLHCIGTTKRGDPLHPSRAPYSSSPMVWREEESAEVPNA